MDMDNHENLVMDLKSLDASGNNTLSTKVLDPLVITHGNGQSSSSMEEFGAADTKITNHRGPEEFIQMRHH